MPTRGGPVDNSPERYIADGTYYHAGLQEVLYNPNPALHLPPVFQRWVVMETFCDPLVLDDAKIASIYARLNPVNTPPEKRLRISNLNILKSKELPRNTILAKRVLSLASDGHSLNSDQVSFLYPFFPSHLSLPCKPGEFVWVVFDSLTDLYDLGYWMCGIVGPSHVEDPNFSHFPRINDNLLVQSPDVETFAAHESNEQNNIIPRKYHFGDGTYLIDARFSITSDGYIKKTLQEAEGSVSSVYEPVPRFKKRPSDVVLEGSNNTLIVLGRDRTGSAVSYTKEKIAVKYDDNREQILEIGELDQNQNPPFGFEVLEYQKINIADSSFQKKNAGSIDIVVGRGQITGSLGTLGKVVLNDLNNQELSKYKSDLVPNEGDPDFRNDRSRIYVSQNTAVDASLGISSQNQQQLKIQDTPQGDAGIIIKSDKIRIFARSDVQILVSGFDSEEKVETYQTNPSAETKIQSNVTFSDTIKNEKTNSDNWASITIKSTGDIVFTPSKTGLIKLGGDDANKAILCTENLDPKTTPTVADGQVTVTNMLTQGADALGTGAPGQGTFATKILVK